MAIQEGILNMTKKQFKELREGDKVIVRGLGYDLVIPLHAWNIANDGVLFGGSFYSYKMLELYYRCYVMKDNKYIIINKR